jgi:hypothetical protein
MTTDAHDEPLTPEEEAEMQKEIELALEPYKDKAPPHLLQQMRERLEEGARTQPVMRGLLRRFAPRPDVGASATVARREDDEEAEEKGS